MSLGIWLFILALLVVIMIHEAGHFAMAKLFNFKATKFFLGFGPTLWSFTKGETEYGVKAIPAGGFVKIVGMNPYEDVPPEDRVRSYENKPAWQRAIVLVAGSATHWVVAFLLLLFAALAIGFPAGLSNRLEAVTVASAADEGGLLAGDEIVAVDGTETQSWNVIREFIRDHGGERAEFTVLRDGETRTFTTTLSRGISNEDGLIVDEAEPGEQLRPLKEGEEVVGFFGVEPSIRYETEPFPQAIGTAAVYTGRATVEAVKGVGDVGSMIFGGRLIDALTGEGTREADGESPVGVVGASRIASEIVASGQYLNFIGFIVSFTIFIGLMNLLPLPPLDGGHLAVVAWESVTGRKVDVRKLIPVAAAVISFFVIIFIAVLYLDIARPIKVPF
ncbi:MAG: M50 family metallopeptidase [Actinomycetota bacterium]|nr:RIP metalloprotease [Actinomycetota bacterium]